MPTVPARGATVFQFIGRDRRGEMQFNEITFHRSLPAPSPIRSKEAPRRRAQFWFVFGLGVCLGVALTAIFLSAVLAGRV